MYHIGMKSAEQLLALINDTNSLTLTFDDVEFGTPSALTLESQEGEENPANTEVVMTAKPNRKPVGNVVVKYDRIDLAEFETLGDPHGIAVDTPVTHASVVEAFNRFYGSALELVDVDQTTELPANLDEDEVVELKASAESLAYRGSIELLVESGGIDLNTAISNKDLSGLVLRFASAQQPA